MAIGNIDELIAVLEANARQNSDTAAGRLASSGSPGTPSQPTEPANASELLRIAAIPDANVPAAAQTVNALDPVAGIAGSAASAGDLGRLSTELELLRRATAQQTESLVGNTQALMDSLTSKVSGAAGTAGASAGNVLTNVVGSMFGLSPIISGVLNLLGVGKHETPPPLMEFALPQAVKQDMGIQADNSFAALTYGDAGVAKSAPAATASQPAQINVQVQAMDSRSFMDRSDDIARAVKEAMLHSHSLNDVVVDL
jgi:hypothetical protein